MDRSNAILERFRGLYPREIDLSLDRMRVLLAKLGHPDLKLPPVFHIAGTNGKGSTTAFLRAMLEAAGKSRARLHLAAPRPLPRAHAHRRARRRPFRRRGRPDRGAARGGARQRRHADPAIRDHHRRRLQAVRRPPGRLPAARSRPWRSLRRHQRRRPTRWSRPSPPSRWITRSSSAIRSRRSPARRPASSSATVRSSLRRSANR